MFPLNGILFHELVKPVQCLVWDKKSDSEGKGGHTGTGQSEIQQTGQQQTQGQRVAGGGAILTLSGGRKVPPEQLVSRGLDQ